MDTFITKELHIKQRYHRWEYTKNVNGYYIIIWLHQGRVQAKLGRIIRLSDIFYNFFLFLVDERNLIFVVFHSGNLGVL